MFEDLNAYQLAKLADCATPDTLDSPGAHYLRRIAEDAAEAIDDDRLADEDRGDIIHELADTVVPVYTRDVWATFVDLAAYQEEDETGSMAHYVESEGSAGMTRAAMIALYQIATRLYAELFDIHDDETEDDEGDEDDE